MVGDRMNSVYIIMKINNSSRIFILRIRSNNNNAYDNQKRITQMALL